MIISGLMSCPISSYVLPLAAWLLPSNQGASPGTSVLCYLDFQGHCRDAQEIVKSLFTFKKTMRCGQCEGPGALVPPQPGSVLGQALSVPIPTEAATWFLSDGAVRPAGPCLKTTAGVWGGGYISLGSRTNA